MTTQKTLKEWISRDLFIWFAVNAAFVGGTAVYSAVRDSATYNFYNNKISSWFDGQRECSKEGGHLVVLETESKWRFITEEIQSLTNPSLNEWHIGLSANYTNASDWRWITGQPLTNPHWQVHEPSGDGKCAIIAKQYPEGMYGHFNDLSCKSLKAFICEVERLSSESNKVLSERWIQIDGSAVKDLTTDPKFQKNATKIKYLRDFKDVVYGQKFGGRYRSYLLANQTGNYTFYTICDDTCQLFLSNGINPRDKHIIIDQTKNVPRFNKTACCNVATLQRFQISSPQYLEKNTVYYMEVLFKQGGGLDQMIVGMRTPSGEMKVPITGDDLIRGISDEFAPAEYCVKKGDPNYPDYIKDCNEFPDSQKIGIVLSLLEDWQSRVDKASNITADFLLHVMETAGKRTSELLESLNDSFVDENMNKSNPGFEIAKEVEKLGEIIASRITDTSTVIAVNYSSVDMKASYGEKNFSFVAERSEEKGTGSQDSINIELENSATKMAHFFSAFYKTLHKAIQQNISDVEGGNPSSQQSPHFLNSRIISGSALRPVNETFNGKVTIRLGHTQLESSDKMTMVCAFWRYTNSSSSPEGHWSTEGCHKDEQLSNDRATVCHCNHLTHFAVLMRVTDKREVVLPSEPHIRALEAITYVGCGLSLLGEILTIVTLTFLKLTRSETSIIHLNLVAALAAAQIIFLTGIEATQNKAACKIVAVLLHYFNLVSFTWMLAEGIWLYVMIVRVFESGHSRIKKYCACAWGIPFVFVVITLSASFDGYGTDRSCWLSVKKGTIWSFVIPVLLIAVANSIILGMVVKEILRLNHPTNTENTKYQSARAGVKSAIVLLPLLGITWLFGVLTFNSGTLAFQYLFAIFSSLQGFFIFLFHCLLNSEVRRVFHRKTRIWSESHDMFHTHSLSPQNYNDISKNTLSTRNGSLRPGSGGSSVSNLSQRPSA